MNKGKIGPILRKARKATGKGLIAMESETGIGKSTLSNIEKGFPSVADDKYIHYAQVLGIAEKLFNIVSESEQQERNFIRRFHEIEGTISANPIDALNQIDIISEGSNLEEHPSLLPMIYYLKGRAFFAQEKWKEAGLFFKESADLIKDSVEWKQSNILSICYNYLGLIEYFYKSDFDTALDWVIKGIKIFDRDGKRSDKYYTLLLNKAIYLEKMKRNEKALRAVKNLHHEITKARINENEFFYIRQSIVTHMYMIFGTVLNNLGLNEEALEYTRKGIKIATINKHYDYLFILWTTMGIICYSLSNDEEAIIYYEQALRIKEKVTSNNYLSFAYANLSALLIKQKKFQQAEKYMKKSLEISKKISNMLRQTEALAVMGNWYMEQSRHQEALEFLLEGQQIAHHHKFVHEEQDLLTDICTCNEELNHSASYLNYLKKLHRLRKQMKQKQINQRRI